MLDWHAVVLALLLKESERVRTGAQAGDYQAHPHVGCHTNHEKAGQLSVDAADDEQMRSSSSLEQAQCGVGQPMATK